MTKPRERRQKIGRETELEARWKGVPGITSKPVTQRKNRTLENGRVR